MKVKELIEELQEHDQEAEVVWVTDQGVDEQILEVFQPYGEEGTVCLL